MHKFNSLGSNYNLKFLYNTKLSLFDFNATRLLISYLEKTYSGKAKLFLKGREAMHYALSSCNFKKSSYIVIVGYTCFSVYKSIVEAGFIPLYLDIDTTLNFEPNILEKICQDNKNISAVIVQNTLGFVCDIKRIKEICNKFTIVLIEDVAHCVGGKYLTGQQVGCVGDITIFSFSQDKLVDGVTGGAVVFRNNNIISGLKTINYEKTITIKYFIYPFLTFIIRKTYHIKIGKIIHYLAKSFHILVRPVKESKIKYHCLPSWCCSLILSSFKNYKRNSIHRKQIAQIYIKNLPLSVLIENNTTQYNNAILLRFPIMINNKIKLFSHLSQFGWHFTDTWYDAPIAPKKLIAKTNYNNECKNAEKIASYMVNLPTHQDITTQDAENISQKINVWLKQK